MFENVPPKLECVWLFIEDILKRSMSSNSPMVTPQNKWKNNNACATVDLASDFQLNLIQEEMKQKPYNKKSVYINKIVTLRLPRRVFMWQLTSVGFECINKRHLYWIWILKTLPKQVRAQKLGKLQIPFLYGQQAAQHYNTLVYFSKLGYFHLNTYSAWF